MGLPTSPARSTHFSIFFLLVATFGNINVLPPSHSLSLSHTHILFLFLLAKGKSTSFISFSTLGQLTDLSFFPLVRLYFKLCGRMSGCFAAEDLVSQGAVGGQFCWQSDRLTHLGHCGSARSLPPCCIPSRAGAADLLNPQQPHKRKSWQNQSTGLEGSRNKGDFQATVLGIILQIQSSRIKSICVLLVSVHKLLLVLLLL